MLGIVLLLLAAVLASCSDREPDAEPQQTAEGPELPAGGPTGKTRVVAGIEFVEVSPGCCRIKRPALMSEGEDPSEHLVERLIEVPERFWIGQITLQRADWPGSPTWPQVCEKLSERCDGTLRRPARGEMLYASCKGLLGESFKENLSDGPWQRGEALPLGSRFMVFEGSEFEFWLLWWSFRKDEMERLRGDLDRMEKGLPPLPEPTERVSLLVWVPPRSR